MNSTITIGFWGEPTSTVDWCEKNYEVTYYVAEFFNTISSLCLIFMGTFGSIMHAKGFDYRFTLCFRTIIVIGFGSILFHGTLLYKLQHFDGIPMTFYMLVVFYSVTENKKERRFGNWFPITLFVWGSTVSIAMIFLGGYQIKIMKLAEFYLFQVSFFLISLCVYLRIIAIVFNLKGEKIIRTLMLRGSIIFLTGYLGWHIDYSFCKVISESLNPQLHAWWHVTTSYSNYLICLIVMFDRSKMLGKKPKIKWTYIIFPYVTLSEELIKSEVISPERTLLMQQVSIDN